ncbi:MULTISPECIES: hypothetical protein [unclassified Blautia]|uniref:hypothetical protein n=1 Tax=unclassified Blautia TaxID=2648079 RepID=UPI001FA9EE45|nr:MULTISPECIES: hypothetical protein [unclassified Blautia]
MIDTIIFDVGRVLVNWDYESYLKRFAFGPEKTKAITAATSKALTGASSTAEFSHQRRL